MFVRVVLKALICIHNSDPSCHHLHKDEGQRRRRCRDGFNEEGKKSGQMQKRREKEKERCHLTFAWRQTKRLFSEVIVSSDQALG